MSVCRGWLNWNSVARRDQSIGRDIRVAVEADRAIIAEPQKRRILDC